MYFAVPPATDRMRTGQLDQTTGCPVGRPRARPPRAHPVGPGVATCAGARPSVVACARTRRLTCSTSSLCTGDGATQAQPDGSYCAYALRVNPTRPTPPQGNATQANTTGQHHRPAAQGPTLYRLNRYRPIRINQVDTEQVHREALRLPAAAPFAPARHTSPPYASHQRTGKSRMHSTPPGRQPPTHARVPDSRAPETYPDRPVHRRRVIRLPPVPFAVSWPPAPSGRNPCSGSPDASGHDQQPRSRMHHMPGR